MERQHSSYRSLLPWTTKSIVSPEPYPEQLPPDSPFVDFAAKLEAFDRAPNQFPYWGTYAPADLLHDGDGHEMPRVRVHRVGDGKLALKVVDGLMMYTSAARLLDNAQRLYGHPSVREGVLMHPKQTYWIGRGKFLSDLQDIVATVAPCMGPVDERLPLATPDEATLGESCAVRLANEITSIHGSMRQLSAIRNIAILAFNISIMMKGYLQVPDNALSMGIDPNLPGNRNITRLLSKPRRLRLAMFLASAISPLVVFLEDDITKHTVCVEELLWNLKRLGNDKPTELVTMEDGVWHEVHLVAQGKQSARTAFGVLNKRWSDQQLMQKMGKAARFFFARPGVVSFRSDISLYGATPSTPYPESWPIPPLAVTAIEVARKATPDEEVTEELEEEKAGAPRNATATTDGQDQPPVRGRDASPVGHAVPPSNGGADQPMATPSPISETPVTLATLAPKKSNDKEKKPAGAKRPTRRSRRLQQPKKATTTRRKPRKRSNSMIEESDDEQSDSDIELLEYSELKKKGQAERVLVNRDLVVKLEEKDVLRTPSPNGFYVKPRVVIGDATTVAIVISSHLCHSKQQQRYSDTQPRTMKLWNAKGHVFNIKPFIHLEEDYNPWMNIYDTFESQLVANERGERRPAFLNDPGSSIFMPLPYHDYMTVGDSLTRHRVPGKSVVLTDSPGMNLNFDKKGLETVEVMDHRTELQDMTLSVSNDFSVRRRQGDLQALLDSSRSPEHWKKALNALDLPNPNAAVEPAPFASDVWAVRRTKELPGCLRTIPTTDVRFGLAGTRGAISFWHFDPHGEGTFVRVACGMKLWAIAVPKDPKVATSTRTWSSQELDVRNLDLTEYRVEMILLGPGDTLLLESGAIHAVLTIEDAICHGGHYLDVSSLQQIVFAAVHTYFEGRVATNTKHESFWGRINSLACFMHRCIVVGDGDEEDAQHLPDLSTPQGLQTFLLFACLIEVQHVLCPESYQITEDEAVLTGLGIRGLDEEEVLHSFDVSAVPHSARVQRVYNRGRIEATVKTVCRHSTVLDVDGRQLDVWHDLFVPMQAWFICALKDYYERSSSVTTDDETEEEEETNSDDGSVNERVEARDFPPPKDLFTRQLEWSTENRDEVRQLVTDMDARGVVVDSLLWPFPEVTIKAQDAGSTEVGEEMAASQLFEMGLRGGDTLYFHAYPNITRLEKVSTRRGASRGPHAWTPEAKRRKIN